VIEQNYCPANTDNELDSFNTLFFYRIINTVFYNINYEI